MSFALSAGCGAKEVTGRLARDRAQLAAEMGLNEKPGPLRGARRDFPEPPAVHLFP